jgi:hypothetical protein
VRSDPGRVPGPVVILGVEEHPPRAGTEQEPRNLMDGQVQYVDAQNRMWVITQRGLKWFARTDSEVIGVTDYNLYQLFQQIDKRLK